ncbi:DUF2793 domain-containing protein [Flaviflagellibacter deserti]|uniref:DUF2793 domain-containing protein n=1 Tax=Flaviflagellibacter deserti TaxID=2267266 RepID=A0ABV9YY70_9HYPH
MSETTSNLRFPLLAASQAQKHVTVNEALSRLDNIVQLSVLDRTRTAPPPDPEEGERHIVGPGATGGWAGKDGRVAAFQNGGWVFIEPGTGWIAWDAEAEEVVAFSGGIWQVAGGTFQDVPRFGLGTMADETNPFSAKLNSALWTALEAGAGGTGDLRYVMNKEGAGDVLSILLQSAYGGRAELGLIGDEDFVLKVSADGATWHEALRIDRATGRPRFPQGGVREQLSANRTYHVRADGSDANDGLANTAGGAFATVQKAYDVIAGTLDLAGFTTTIEIGAGTFSGLTIAKGWTGGGSVVLDGAGATTVLSGIGHLVQWTAPLPGDLRIKDLKLTTVTSGDCLRGDAPGRVVWEAVEFSACAGRHVAMIAPGARAECAANYTISGGAVNHWVAEAGAAIQAVGRTIALTGTPAFTTFSAVAAGGSLLVSGDTFSGSATGTRYSASTCGTIRTNGGGANYLPGNAVGAVSTSGQYV